MILNATLVSVEVPDGSGGGDLTYAAPVAVGVRCAAQQPAARESLTADARQQRAALQVTVRKGPLGLAPRPAAGQRWTVKIDGGAAVAYRVAEVADWQKAGLSNYVVQLVTE